ncbi:MAG: Trk system potassium transporter TrkA [Clostridia bacterium]|nr:Trk system potassium transporter TrkA [Clostridiales bacterium]
MRIIIVGAGKVGYQLVESLAKENHDIMVVDTDQEVLDKINDNFDVLTKKGNGISSSLLKGLNIEGWDLLIAVTNSDEANIVACITAKKVGVKTAIARVRNPEYVVELDFMRSNLGIDYIINPEYATANEIIRLILNTHTSYAADFAKGHVRMSEIIIEADSGFAGKQIKDIKLPGGVVITAIVRNREVIIPNGFDHILHDDTLYIMGEKSAVDGVAKTAGVRLVNNRVRNVMIIGGGKIGYYLAKGLECLDINVKLIEQDMDRCRELSEGLNDALVLHGDGTDITLLKAENIGGMDAFLAVTGYDEENLLVSVLAKQMGAKKVIAKVSRSNYTSVLETIGIDNAVSPKLITASDILRIVRGGRIVSISLLIGGQAEVLEIIPQEGTPILNKPLKDLGMPKGIIFGAILRHGKVIIPNGDSVITSSDRVIVFTLDSHVETVSRLFGNRRGGLGLHELLNSAKNAGNAASM